MWVNNLLVIKVHIYSEIHTIYVAIFFSIFLSMMHGK